MGGSKSTTIQKTEYKERPLTEEEKDLLRAIAENARKYGLLAEESAERSRENYEHWKQYFKPLETGFITKTLEANAQLGTPEARLLNLLQAAAVTGSQKGGKLAMDNVKKIFAQRGLSGSGLEAKALSSVAAAQLQNTAAATSSALMQAIQQSDRLRLQRLSNLANVINVGRGFSASGFNYQGLAGQQYGGSGQLYSQAFQDWDKRWKQQSFMSQKSRSFDMGSLVSFGFTGAI